DLSSRFIIYSNISATIEFYTLSLHDALPISIKQTDRASRFFRSGWQSRYYFFRNASSETTSAEGLASLSASSALLSLEAAASFSAEVLRDFDLGFSAFSTGASVEAISMGATLPPSSLSLSGWLTATSNSSSKLTEGS